MAENCTKKNAWTTISEVVRSFCTQERNVFYLAFGLACFCSLCYCLFFTDIHRDTAGVYALYAAEIGKGNWREGIVSNVPMLNILMGGLLARCGIEVMTALTLVSCFFYTAAVFPLRRFLERYVSPLMAAWGCVLYVTCPKLILFSCSPLLESARFFFMICALLYFFRCADEANWKSAVLCGLSCGALTVSRGEGLPITVALLVGYLPFLKLFRRQKTGVRQFLILLLIVFSCIITTLPFCSLNYMKSGYFITDTRAVEFAEKVITLFRDAPESGTAEASKVFMSEEEGNTSWGAKIGNVASGILRGGYELYCVLAFLGMILTLRRRQWKSDYFVLLGLSLMLCMIYILIVSSYRYYLFLVPLFMMFTLIGLDSVRVFLLRVLPEKVRFLPGILVVFILLGQLCNGVSRAFSDGGKYYRNAGLWIAEYGKKNHPDRPLRVYAYHIPEVIYWSKAVQINAYGKPFIAPETVQDFDLIVCRKRYAEIFLKRTDLERVTNVPGDGKSLMIFRKK